MVQLGADWCDSVQDFATCCNLVQEWWVLVQTGAPLQVGSTWCIIVYVGSDWCNLVEIVVNCLSLVQRGRDGCNLAQFG